MTLIPISHSFKEFVRSKGLIWKLLKGRILVRYGYEMCRFAAQNTTLVNSSV